MMRWDWLRYDWLGHRISDCAYLWEIPEPLPPRALTPSPRHTHRALTQGRDQPVIRSWLGGRSTDPTDYPLTDCPLDMDLTTDLTCGRVLLVGPGVPFPHPVRQPPRITGGRDSDPRNPPLHPCNTATKRRSHRLDVQ